MGTKLRKFSSNIVTKLSACLIILICAALCGALLSEGLKIGININSLFSNNFINVGGLSSQKDRQKINDAFNLLEMQQYEAGLNGETYKFVLPEELNSGRYDYYVKLADGSVFQSKAVSDVGIVTFENTFNNYYSEDTLISKFADNDFVRWHYNDVYAESIFEKVIIKYSFEEFRNLNNQWSSIRHTSLMIIRQILALLAIALVFFIYLCIVAGRKPKDNELHLNALDRIYSDVLLGLGFVAAMIAAFFAVEIVQDFNYLGNTNNFLYTASIVGLIASIVSLALVILTALLSVVRKIKARKFIKHSLIYVVLRFIYRGFKKILDLFKCLFDGRAYKNYPLTQRLFYSQLAFIGGSFVAVAMFAIGFFFPPLIIFPLAGEFVLIYWYIKGNQNTYDEINRGFNESLEEQMKAERMKISLVTNVSHDLKTPLTSIISYVDLLSKEPNLSVTAKEYISILAEKSDRLKHIVADLFDLAKSTSGNILLDIEELDIKKLVEQTVADMQDKIDESGLTLRLNLDANPVMINSDGKRLYRVLQNIIDNALKYSLKGTRVYIDLVVENGNALIAVKNTAGYEMDFTPSEVLQRFSRGDKSRSTEGNGLGLSIAQSFTYACGGDFDVIIDGDLFKVVVKLKAN